MNSDHFSPLDPFGPEIDAAHGSSALPDSRSGKKSVRMSGQGQGYAPQIEAHPSEAAFLGAVLISPELWDACGDDLPSPDDFASPAMSEMMRFLVELRMSGGVPDAVELFRHASERAENPPTLRQIQDVVEAAVSLAPGVVRSHARRIRRDAQMRSILSAVGEAYQEALRPDGRDPGAVMDRVTSIVIAAAQSKSHGATREVAELSLAELESLDQRVTQGDPPGWSTGLDALDQRLSGGLREGMLYVLAARPGVGKSAFALQIAVHQSLHGRKAAFLSLEMPAAEQSRRALCNLARVDLEAIQEGRAQDIDWSALADAVERLGHGAGLWIDDQSGPDVGTLARKIKTFASMGVRVLVLDYLQLCSVPGKQNRTTEIGEITRTLKNLAKAHGMAIICLSQLNREVEKRVNPRPTLADLRDSGEIEQDADAILFLWRDTDDEQGPLQIGCAIEKNRQGRRGAFALTFNGRYQHFGVSTEPLRTAGKSGAGGGRRIGVE
jgi:replicative DNA helicase